MAKEVKMCDLPLKIAVEVFEKLNPELVVYREHPTCPYDNVIFSDTNPHDLIYPEGWYYFEGCFTNKNTSTSGVYEDVYLMTSDGKYWGDLVDYSTLE